MRTSLIRVVGSATEGHEAQLHVDWDGAMPPREGATRAQLGQLPRPPEPFQSLSEFILGTAGPSEDFQRLGRELGAALLPHAIRDDLKAEGDEPMRLLLERPPERSDEPWELMRSADGERLFTDVKLPVARITESYD